MKLFYAPGNSELPVANIVQRMSCTYTGTYLLRVNAPYNTPSVNVLQATSSARSSGHHPPPASTPHSAVPNTSQHSRVHGRGSLSNVIRPIVPRALPITTNSTAAIPNTTRDAATIHWRIREDDDSRRDSDDSKHDSDDSRQASVKRLKDSQVKVEGKT